MLYLKLRGFDKAILEILQEEADIYTLSVAKQLAVRIREELPQQIDVHRSRQLKNRNAVITLIAALHYCSMFQRNELIDCIERNV